MLLLWIALIILCAILGYAKGYSVGLCILAGALGSVIALIVLLLLPDRNAEQVELDRRDQEIDALRQRIAQLEQAQSQPAAPAPAQPLPQPSPCAPASAAGRARPLSHPDPGDHFLPRLRQAPAGQPGPVLFLQAPLYLRR